MGEDLIHVFFAFPDFFGDRQGLGPHACRDGDRYFQDADRDVFPSALQDWDRLAQG